MRKNLIGVSAGVVLLFGCSHAPSTMPQPIGHIQPNQIHADISISSLPRHYTVLYAFQRDTDGIYPQSDLVLDAAGNLYGTTTGGGATGNGTVFKVDPNGNETVLHSFTRPDGVNPYSGLVWDSAKNLYGTAFGGGTEDSGVVYKMDTSGNETVLYSFKFADGMHPLGKLLLDSAGNLYGTTLGGGTGVGVVFKLDPSGVETVLHTFGGVDGSSPGAGVVEDSAGNLYGTTSNGGSSGCSHQSGCGVVFKLDASGNETVLHSFRGTDGAHPAAGLFRSAAGSLYGTTQYGGPSGGGPSSKGVAFRLSPSDRETVLHSFGNGGGEIPLADLIRPGTGYLFGTTSSGGPMHWGVVFALDQSGNETVLHVFRGTDGAKPYAGLVEDAAGSLYGTTQYGGSTACPIGCGVVFKITH